MKRNQSTGILLAFGASWALAASFIFSKSALNHLSLEVFGLFWFGMGTFWNGAWFLINKEAKELRSGIAPKSAVALAVALLEGLATALFYKAIQAMENPAVVSFIGNIGPVFVTILGITLLKERFGKSQVAGIVLTIVGVFQINYREGGFAGFTDPGSIYVICAALLFSMATIVGRKYHHLMVPGYMSLIRSFILALGMGALTLNRGTMTLPSVTVWRDLALGSILETLIVIVFAYHALKLIEATRTSLIISSKGVWTLLLALAFLGVFPTPNQLMGGVLTLAGVWLISRHPPG